MAIPIKLKKRWDVYPTLQEVLTATQNLSVSPRWRELVARSKFAHFVIIHYLCPTISKFVN